MRRNLSLSLVAAVTLMACSSIRLEYNSEVVTSDKDAVPKPYHYENSYSVAGNMWACIGTGILYGGWCWAYLAMPFDGQTDRISNDAAANLKDISGGATYKERAPRVDRQSWEPGAPAYSLTGSKLNTGAVANDVSKSPAALVELKKAKALIGKPVWLRNTLRVQYRPLPDGHNGSVDYHNLEMMTVVDADTEMRPYMYGSGDVTLKIKNKDGKIGLIKYNRLYLFDANPIDHTWSRQIKDAIAKGVVIIGMTKNQVTIVLGEPEKINTTVGAAGVHEQWVYGFGTFFYFDDNKMTTAQFSK